MNVYRLRRFYVFHIIFLCLVPFILIGIYDNRISKVEVFIMALFSTSLVLSVLLTSKIYLNSENINIEWYLKRFQLRFKWKDIKKVEFKYHTVCLHNNTGKKIMVTSFLWSNHKQLWLHIYEEIIKNNKECIFDDSFSNIINRLGH